MAPEKCHQWLKEFMLRYCNKG